MRVEISPHGPEGEVWKPRGFQKDVIKKFKEYSNLVLTITRQVGKTEICIVLLYHFLFFYKKRLNPVAYVFMQDYQQVNSIYFKRLMVWLEKLPPNVLTFKASKDNNSRGFIILKRPWIGDVSIIYFMSHNASKSIRGSTADLLIVDESAEAKKVDWFNCISPLRDDTGGKAILTSTYKGPNWYYELQKFAQKEEEAGHKGWASIILTLNDMVEQGVRTKDWAEAKEREYEAAGAYEDFLSQYQCDPYAGSAGEFPFGARLHKRNNQLVPFPEVIERDTVVFCALDIGREEHMPSWSFIIDQHTGVPCMIGFRRGHSSFEALIGYIMETYKNYKRSVIFLPHDGLHTIPALGFSQFQLLRNIIRNKGMHKKIFVEVLEKPKDKKAYLKYTIHNIIKWNFADTPEVVVGRDRLRNYRFKKDPKTGVVQEYMPVKNLSAHVADATCYAFHSLKHIPKYLKMAPNYLVQTLAPSAKLRYTIKKRK